ncbi:MAG: hypothetical protein AAB491_01035 [Patescibacteria group bacterium]
MKNFIKQTSILSIAITVAFVIYMGVQIAQGAGTWNDPTAVPPGDNTEEPINAGNKPQTKSGNLTVDVLRAGGLVSDFSSYLATISGSVGIGTVSPNTGGEQNLKLDVEGAVGAEYYCDKDGNNCVAGGSLGGGGGGLRTYIGTTSSSYTGNIGGYSVANSYCNSAFPGSRMCMAADFVNGRPTATGWYSAFIFTGGPFGTSDCESWTYQGSGNWTQIWDISQIPPQAESISCNNVFPILCCE